MELAFFLQSIIFYLGNIESVLLLYLCEQV